MDLLDQLLEIVDSGYAPAPGSLEPNNDIVHDYYFRLYNVIKDAEKKREAENAKASEKQESLF